MEIDKAHFENDHFAAAAGVELVDVQPGRATARLVVDRRHMNNLELVHGGAIFTLAAAAMFAACNAAGKAAVGINLNISYLEPVREGTLTAEAVEISRSRKVSTTTVRVLDEQERLIAQLQGTAYIKNEPYPPHSPV
ncbi:MAG: PaaI family thioesterase [Thermoguttaceae bacterium]